MVENFWGQELTSLIIVMGVSGCGKTVVGQHLARQLGIVFIDGDDLHTKENVERMRAGIPMDDESRKPWLQAICDCAESHFGEGNSVVIACSALKAKYREKLRSVSGPVVFLYLHGDSAIILERMNSREGHYMPASLLDSQIADMENPIGEPGVIQVDVGQPLEKMLQEANEKTRVKLARTNHS